MTDFAPMLNSMNEAEEERKRSADIERLARENMEGPDAITMPYCSNKLCGKCGLSDFLSDNGTCSNPDCCAKQLRDILEV